MVFDSEGPPTLSDNSTTTGVRAWSDAFTKSLKTAGMTAFNLEGVLEMLQQDLVAGSDMWVPIGHGEGRLP